ncbi:MAG: HPr family phosphocarrier protein [Acholeplasmataceae bacterium]|nr:HPr family phosphocarrier protein [Acholeplasmataceae bacterium]
MEKEFVLKAEQGLHARPATNFVRFMSSLPFTVYLIYKDFVADAKSIMAIMSVGLAKDSVFKIKIESENHEHMKQIEQYLKENHLI